MRFIFTVVFLGLATFIFGNSQDPQPTPTSSPAKKEEQIRSIRVSAVGQSFVGPKYSKSITVTRTNSKYTFSYACQTRTSEFSCPCQNFIADIEKEEAEALISRFDVNSGVGSICCDHPYTTIITTYEDQKTKTVSFGADVLTQEEKKTDEGTKILGINCNRARPSPTIAP